MPPRPYPVETCFRGLMVVFLRTRYFITIVNFRYDKVLFIMAGTGKKICNLRREVKNPLGVKAITFDGRAGN